MRSYADLSAGADQLPRTRRSKHLPTNIKVVVGAHDQQAINAKTKATQWIWKFKIRRHSREQNQHYLEGSMVGSIPLACVFSRSPWGSDALNSQFVAESGESVDPVEARIIASISWLRADPSLSPGSSSNASCRSGTGHCNTANSNLMRPEATADQTGHAIGRSDRTCGRNVRRS
jgi:hypothetical protein